MVITRSIKTCLAIGLVQGVLLWLARSITENGLKFALVTAVLVGASTCCCWAITCVSAAPAGWSWA